MPHATEAHSTPTSLPRLQAIHTQPPPCDEACEATCLPACYQACANGIHSQCPAFAQFGGSCPDLCDAKCCSVAAVAPVLTVTPELAVPSEVTLPAQP
jgi:hypothetical protein